MFAAWRGGFGFNRGWRYDRRFHTEEVRMSRQRGLMVLAVAAAGAMVAGCSALDLGPEPSNIVEARKGTAVSLTDPELQAVTPASSRAQGTLVPAATMPGEAVIPETMP